MGAGGRRGLLLTMPMFHLRRRGENGMKKIPANHIQELLYLVLSFLVKDKQRPHCWEGLFSADFHIYLKTVKDIDFVDIDGVNIGCNIASTRG